MGKGWTFLTQLHSLAGPVLQLLYPLYASVMAIESTSKLDDEQWLAYWIIYSFLTLLEMVIQPALEWMSKKLTKKKHWWILVLQSLLSFSTFGLCFNFVSAELCNPSCIISGFYDSERLRYTWCSYTMLLNLTSVSAALTVL